MKKVLSVLVWILLVLLAFVPLGAGISAIFGYSFELANYWAFALADVSVAAILVLLSLISKETVDGKVSQILFALITPCALINTMFYVTQCGKMWLALSLLLCVGCGYLTIRHGRPLSVRAGALVLTAALVLPVCLICVLLTAIGNAQVQHVVKSVDSPNGVYYAQIINSDQGNMGGDTIVKVYSHKGLNAGLFKISKKPLVIYIGGEDEYKTMELVWINDERLLIDSKEYFIKK